MLEDINGIGKSTIKLLNKLGINNNIDLVEYYPFRYNNLVRTNFNNINDKDNVVTDGVVESLPYLIHFKGKMNKMSFKLRTFNNLINVVIYNRGFYKSKLVIGSTITIIGKYDLKHNTVIASEIRFSELPNEAIIEPIYHSTYGLSSRELSKFILEVLDTKVIDYIPSYLIDKYNFIDKNNSVRIVHSPNNMDEVKSAIKRLKYEELFLFMLKMNYLKDNKSMKVGLSRSIDYNKVLELMNNLPFKLTDDQLKAVDDIYNDLINPKRMNRLLQGDVGSGKTIVSVVAIYINYLGGYQSALMAPTEILAIQHYNNIKKLLPNLSISLLTGKLKVSERKNILKDISSGEINLVIGTQALFSDDVLYNNLGLVVTDEQHRFGVNQRASLKNKGITPDILYMSATPIPRTYAFTIYGDMDISSIRTMPSGRLPIITYLKDNKRIKEVLDLIYNELKLHYQVYVIAPLIEESDKLDLDDVYKLEKNMNLAFGKICNIEVLHGKMDNKEKEEVMARFKDNKTQILISTTVIEVGVDVSNATMMVIYDADRFGLSQLHQLRGRVGRNNYQSYCVLISNKEADRLNVLVNTNDGFKVSEEDFKLRGSGDLFGTKQSGDMVFKLANIKNDFNMLLLAKEDSKEFLDKYIDDYKDIKNLIVNNNNLD